MAKNIHVNIYDSVRSPPAFSTFPTRSLLRAAMFSLRQAFNVKWNSAGTPWGRRDQRDELHRGKRGEEEEEEVEDGPRGERGGYNTSIA